MCRINVDAVSVIIDAVAGNTGRDHGSFRSYQERSRHPTEAAPRRSGAFAATLNAQ
jgi:hypothetical protein